MTIEDLTTEQLAALHAHFDEGRKPILVAMLTQIPAPVVITAWRAWSATIR
jgi:hypothetical protein